MAQKLTLLLLFFFIPFTFSPILGQEENERLILSLSECEELAFKNNLAIEEARLGLEISKAKLTRAKHAKILPRFELRNVWGPSPRARGELAPSGGFVISPDTATSIPGDLRYFTELDVDLLQPIFTFGRLSGATKAASFGVEAEEANVLKEKGKVRFQVRQLYWAFVLGKELLAVVQDADEELTKAENKVEKQLDEGSDEVSQTDLFKLQIFRYDINERLREARGKRDLTDSALKTTLGLEDDVGIEVATEYLEPLDVRIDSLDVYYEMAYRNRPELSQLRAGISARRALVNVRKSEYFPQFFLGAEIKYNFAEDRFDPNNPFIYNPTNFFRPGIVAGINLNLNFWQTRDKVRIAQAEYLQLAQKEKLLLDGIKFDVQRVYIELRQVARNMRDSRRALKASENWLRSTSMTFDIGVGDVKELIDAFKANGAMQAKHLENIFKYNVAIAKLGKAVGKDLYPDELIKE